MAKSKKAKKDKAQDFQKPKLKVGKTKLKSANFTDTSFQSRSIAILQQSLETSSKTPASLFAHHLSLCNNKSTSKQTESLARLITIVEESGPPQPLSAFLPKVAPLLLNLSSTVRSNTLKLLRALPQQDVQQQAGKILLYVRAGMASLSVGVQLTSLDAMEWLIENAGLQVVKSRGGWMDTLQTFKVMLLWNSGKSSGKDTTTYDAWSGSTNTTSGRKPESDNVVAKALRVLSLFLSAGLSQTRDLAPIQAEDARRNFPYTNFQQFMISQDQDSFASVRLIMDSTGGGSSEYLDVEGRRRLFEESMWKLFKECLEREKKAGGSVGREASSCAKVLEECRTKYQVVNSEENLMEFLRWKV